MSSLTPHEWIAAGVVLVALCLMLGRRGVRRRGRRTSISLTESVRLPFGLRLRLRKRL